MNIHMRFSSSIDHDAISCTPSSNNFTVVIVINKTILTRFEPALPMAVKRDHQNPTLHVVAPFDAHLRQLDVRLPAEVPAADSMDGNLRIEITLPHENQSPKSKRTHCELLSYWRNRSPPPSRGMHWRSLVHHPAGCVSYWSSSGRSCQRAQGLRFLK